MEPRVRTFITDRPNLRLYVMLRLVDAGFDKAVAMGMLSHDEYERQMSGLVNTATREMLSGDVTRIGIMTQILSKLITMPADAGTPDAVQFFDRNYDSMTRLYAADQRRYYAHAAFHGMLN